MIVRLDELGQSIPDVEMKEWVEQKFLHNEPIHISNLLTLDHIRVHLLKIKPEVKWIIYGKECEFDKDMKSFDAWEDKRMQILDNCLMFILFPEHNSRD